MKLKDLLNVLDEEMSLTIHQNGELDGNYLQLSDIPYDLYVHIALPEDNK